MSKYPPLQHLAIICDGNRRWAKQQGWKVFQGHEYAVDKVIEPLIRQAQSLGITHLTFWVFSTENWKRNSTEVEYLMDLFRRFFDTSVVQLGEDGIKLGVIGDIKAFAPDIQERIKQAVAKTKHNTKMTVVFAMNYGGRDELVRAMRQLAYQVEQGVVKPEDITTQVISGLLDTAHMPDPDLIIRTGGEQRLSGFMSWQSEYSEFAFPDFYFPEFTPNKLVTLVEEYHHRQRRFGG